jgi:hypothetical protein
MNTIVSSTGRSEKKFHFFIKFLALSKSGIFPQIMGDLLSEERDLPRYVLTFWEKCARK